MAAECDLRLSYARRLHQDGYTEAGAGAAGLVVDDQDTDSLQSRLGLAVGLSLPTDGGMVWTPSASLAWRHEFANAGRVIDAPFAGAAGATFQTAGADAARYAADLADTATGHGGVRVT